VSVKANESASAKIDSLAKNVPNEKQRKVMGHLNQWLFGVHGKRMTARVILHRQMRKAKSSERSAESKNAGFIL
jgi:hypothetical protein